MKKLISLLFAVVICLGLSACAGTKAGSNIAHGDGWIVNQDGVLIISEMKSNKIPSYTYSDPAPWHAYRKLIKVIRIEEGITHIGELAFNSCEMAETVELPASLLQIGDKAFTFCSQLKSITIPDGVNFVGEQAFAQCTALETVHWSSAAFSIHKETFSGCSALKNVEIPEGVSYIQNLSFKDCVSLITLSLPVSLQTFEKDSFEGCTDLILKCNAGTAAEEMAIEHGAPYELIG